LPPIRALHLEIERSCFAFAYIVPVTVTPIGVPRALLAIRLAMEEAMVPTARHDASSHSGFTEQQRWLFDMHGVLTVDDALTSEQCDRLNEAIDVEIARRVETEGLAFQHTAGQTAGPQGEKLAQTLRLGDMFDPQLAVDAALLAHVDNPRVAPILDAMFTSPHIPEGSEKAAAFRIDHVYVDIINPPAWRQRAGHTTDGPIGTGMHKLGLPDAYYRHEGGKMYNGLLTVAYNLEDVDPAEGGFACVLGSHKSNRDDYFESADWRILREESADVRVPDFVTRLGGKKGSAIVFTEALVHGTLPWRAQHQRRTAFFKFNPYSVGWGPKWMELGHFDRELSSRERMILRPPSTMLPSRAARL
jgi:hypothetical protein